MKVRRHQNTGVCANIESNGNLSKTNNSHLSTKQARKKLTVMRAKLSTQRLINFRLAKKLAQTKAKKKGDFSAKIAEYTNRGDISAIVENLKRAFDKGCLAGRSNMIKFIRDITSNMCKVARGKRYSNATKSLYEAVRINCWRTKNSIVSIAKHVRTIR